MKESLYDFLCAAMLGVGNMCMFLGYDTSTTIVEPVLHSVHDRLPDTIDMHAGYNGTAVCLVFLTVVSVAAPWTLGLLGSKGSMLLGSLMFTLHLATFFYIHSIPFYVTSAAIGVGYALFYCGHGVYVTEHSTKQTIERNSAMSYALATSSLIAGGVVVLLTSRPSTEQVAMDFTNDSLTSASAEKSYRQYSDGEIRLMYGVFAAVAVLSNIIFAFLPTRSVENSLALANHLKGRIGLVEQLKAVLCTMSEIRMLLAAPVYLFLGLVTAFWLSIYPATLIYSKRLAEYDNLQAYCIIALGLGEILMGAIISVLSKYIRNFAKMPTMIIGFTLYFIASALALQSTPSAASHTPSDEPTLLFEPSMHLSILIAILLGMTDSALVTSRTVLCSLLIPEKISHVFSISKVYQSLAMSSPLFLSSFISMPMHFVINLAFGIVALFAYYFATRHSSRDEETKQAIPEDQCA